MRTYKYVYVQNENKIKVNNNNNEKKKQIYKEETNGKEKGHAFNNNN